MQLLLLVSTGTDVVVSCVRLSGTKQTPPYPSPLPPNAPLSWHAAFLHRRVDPLPSALRCTASLYLFSQHSLNYLSKVFPGYKKRCSHLLLSRHLSVSLFHNPVITVPPSLFCFLPTTQLCTPLLTNIEWEKADGSETKQHFLRSLFHI